MDETEKQLRADSEVERQALQLAQRQRDHATRWAQYLCHLLEVVYHEPHRITQGGILAAVTAAQAAGFEPIQTEQPGEGALNG
jgi:hypothetical protein